MSKFAIYYGKYNSTNNLLLYFWLNLFVLTFEEDWNCQIINIGIIIVSNNAYNNDVSFRYFNYLQVLIQNNTT